MPLCQKCQAEIEIIRKHRHHFPRRRDIVPRKKVVKLGVKWYVRTPKDLRLLASKITTEFSDEKEAKAYARQLHESRMSGGAEFWKLSPSDQTQLILMLREYGLPFLIEACRLHRERLPGSSKSIMEVAAECADAKRQAGNRPSTMTTFEFAVYGFAKSTDKAIGNVLPADIDAWLHSRPISPKSKLTRLKDVSSMFAWAMRRGLIDRNPCLAVEPPRISHKPAKILSVEDCRKFLAACKEHDPALLGYIVPVLFAGLRPEESRRMVPDMVKPETHECLTPFTVCPGLLDLSGDITKKRKRRVIELNATAKRWLSLPGVKFGNINLIKRRIKICKLAGVKWSHDVLRHSFCSYSLPIHGVRKTAEDAANTESIIFSNYREIVPKAEAEKFWLL